MKKLQLVLDDEQAKLFEAVLQAYQECLYEQLPESDVLLWEVTRLRFIFRHALHHAKEVKK